jgi:hypothetical protein
MFKLLLPVAILLGFSLSANAQEPERVRFTTCDGVTLRGVYYAGKGQDSPAVLLLHDLGDHQRDKNQTALALALHKEGYAVLTFDFRGHGDSTEVDASEFWSPRYTNHWYVKGKGRDEIAFKDFDPRYYPVLINDIAAARAYLDRRNDAKACNSSNLVVIGMKRGATLGAAWINSEFHRFELMPAEFAHQPAEVSKTPEGKKILCAVWLSIDATLGSRRVRLPSLVYAAGRSGKLPMVFFHAKDDAEGARNAAECEKALTKDGKIPFTGNAEVPDAGDAEGADLLQKPGAITAVVEYVENVRNDRAVEWQEHDFRAKQYVWRMPRGLLSANRLGEAHLNFGTYEPFVPVR